MALRCQGLTKRFPGVLALDGLDFTAAAGEVHAILGENGAGKSTLIKALGGSLALDSGTVEVFGREQHIGSPDEAAAHGITVAYQELSLLGDLTVAQNIWLRRGRSNAAGILSRRALRARTEELCARLGAPPISPDSKVRYLSIAERQIVEIVASLASEPRILVLDEATASLAADETRWALELARRLAAEGRLVLFISHRLPEIRQVADRVTILRDGRSVLSGSVADLDDDQMIEAMLGRKAQRLYPPRRTPVSDAVDLAVEGLDVGERVKDVSFELHHGEILGVGGLQGQGQSTLLAALFGLVRSRGTIHVGGKAVRITSPRAAFRAGVGLALIPEDRRTQGLLGTKSIRENISLPVLPSLCSYGFISGAKEHVIVRDAMDRLQVRASSMEQAVTTLSGGNQQKVVIAKLLLVGARILLFHDLTRGIDIGTKAQIFELARELQASGHSIVFYSSDNQELVHMCDRILVMSRGRVVSVLEGALSEDRIMRAAFAAGEAESRAQAGDPVAPERLET